MKSLRQQGFYYGGLLYAFSVPFPQKIINITLIVWILLSLLGCDKSTIIKSKHLWLLPAFYATYFIGFFTSETVSFKFLEYKLSLIIFPSLFVLHTYGYKQRKRILKIFVWGLVASIITCLVVAFYNSFRIQNGNLLFQPNVLEGKGFMESILYGGNYFFGRHLSIFHQTVYYALYLTTGVAVLLFMPKLFVQKLRLTLLILLVGMIFLVSNKASFIALTFVSGFKLWRLNVRPGKKWVSVLLFTIVLLMFALLNPRIKRSIITIAKGQMVLNKEARYGFGTRILSWNTAISLIQERPLLGYGHADTQNVLNNKYKEKGYIYPLKENYNAHNLWLQSWLENGFLAILLLGGVFLVLFYKSFDLSLFLAITFILLINSMFEGLFNRFSGISFFSFLVCFIFSMPKGGWFKT